MRNSIALFCLVFMVLAYGCGSETAKTETKNPIDNDSICQSFYTSPFCSALNSELNDFILKRPDNYAKVISIWMEEQDGDCFLNMLYDICYNEYALCGYYIIDSIMVTYNYIKRDNNKSFAELYQLMDSINPNLFFKESECNFGLVDTTLLIRSIPIDFPNYHQVCTTYDGIGRKYIIHSPDSLELVFEGPY